MDVCSGSATIEVTNPPPFNIHFQIDSIICFGGTGGIEITDPSPLVGPPVGPQGTYSYNWSNGATTEDVMGLTAGTYYITVTVITPFNVDTCTYIDSFLLTQPPLLTVTVPDVALACFGNTTSITATPLGGTAPYTYSWSNNPGLNSPNNPGLGVGNYVVTVTDDNGCTATDLSSITQPAAALSATLNDVTLPCPGDITSITVVVSGGTIPYNYSWSNNPGLNNPTNAGIGIGTYTVTVTDFNGCTTTAQSVIDSDPPVFSLPPDDGSTVPCVSDAQVVPVPPDVFDNCGNQLTVSVPVVGADPVCSGPKTYTFTYTDPITGVFADWVYTYTVVYSGALTPPSNGSSTVSCPSNATNPGPPANILDACGNTVAAVLIGSTSNPSPITCNGTVVWTYRYTACDGITSADWTYTYTVTYSGALTPPPNGSTTVSCPSAATDPGPPASIVDACGRMVSPVLVGSVSNPSPVTCNGTVVWTYRYTACDGTTTADWTYTYTITYSNGLTPPANGSTTSSCPLNATDPGPPGNIVDACGRVVSPVLVGSTSNPSPVTCNGSVVWTYRYTGCDGTTTADWTYTYTITYSGGLTPPANGSSTVPCPVNATDPGPPSNILDACGRSVSPVLVGSTSNPSPVTCNGTVVWTYRYTACDGITSADWTYTYTITHSGSLTPPANGSSTVTCPSNAVDPGPPGNIVDACGNSIPAVLVGSTSNPSPITCNGTVVWTYRYTACDGSTADWTYTYTVTYSGGLTPPANGSSTVACPSGAVDPGSPGNIIDACGNSIAPVLVGSTSNPSPITCNGTVVWTYRYTACDGTTADWTYTYTVTYNGALSPPANGSSTVPCPSNATDPGPPGNITDACGRVVTPVLIGSTSNPSPITCNGTVVWTYRYTACDGTTTADLDVHLYSNACWRTDSTCKWFLHCFMPRG